LRFLIGIAVTFGVNDVYDYDSDIQNRRKNNKWADGTVLDQVNHRFVLASARLSTILVVLLALPASIRSPQLLGYTVSFLSLAWMYSSPPFRLKERPFLDSLSNGAICWLFWACGYIFSGDTTLAFNTQTASRNGWFVLLYASALHSLAAMVDAPTDASAKYRTIATVFGERFAVLFSLISL
jgi:4-hydroxybenzoate polyprenyltransferase